MRRVLRGVVALFALQFLLLALAHSRMGDFVSIAGAFSGPGGRAFMQSQLGLDQPLLHKYFEWLRGFVQLDFGQSFLYRPETVSGILSGAGALAIIVKSRTLTLR